MPAGIPRLYAAASLKRALVLDVNGISNMQWGIPRLYAAASLKHADRWCSYTYASTCIPRLYAAASLKLLHLDSLP